METNQITPMSYVGNRRVVSPMDEKTFSTKDIVLASTLSCLKFTISSISYELGGHHRHPTMIFTYDNTQQLQEVIKRYMQAQLAVEPRAFMNILKSLKAESENYRGSFENDEKSQ